MAKKGWPKCTYPQCTVYIILIDILIDRYIDNYRYLPLSLTLYEKTVHSYTLP